MFFRQFHLFTFSILLFISTFRRISVVFVSIMFCIYLIFILVWLLSFISIFIGFGSQFVSFHACFLAGLARFVVSFRSRPSLSVFYLKYFVFPFCSAITLLTFHSRPYSRIQEFLVYSHNLIIVFSLFLLTLVFLANIFSLS